MKESLVGSVFTAVSPKYDLLNDSMSLGIHRLWKDSFVSSMLPRLPPSLHVPRSPEEWQPSFQCLDVAGGTGDIALRLLDRAREKYSNRDVRVEIVDLNEGMLHEGRKRVAETMYYNSGLQRMCRSEAAAQTRLYTAPQIEFTHGNAQSLPTHIASNSIDLYTIAFGIRNCTSLPAVLSEAYRVLKPGGKLGVLEFGKVSNPVFKE
jgi:2-methoxy-6-polyprenyl-1,4-benzoquinol methylase